MFKINRPGSATDATGPKNPLKQSYVQPTTPSYLFSTDANQSSLVPVRAPLFANPARLCREARVGVSAINVHCDGAVLGNPNGPGGWGFVASANGEIVYRAHGPLIRATSNEAEYRAILESLRWIAGPDATTGAVTIWSDSQLAVNQINNEWNCNEPRLSRLCGECQALIERAAVPVRVAWTPRANNSEADAEAARGVAEALGVTEEEARQQLDAQHARNRALRNRRQSR